MSKEEILTAIQGLAEKLGRVPSLDGIENDDPGGTQSSAQPFYDLHQRVDAVRHGNTGEK